MEDAEILRVVGGIIVLMLGIIGWFLIRFVQQYDEANASHKDMFDKLLKKFDTLTEIIYEHKTDVEVIKEQLGNHTKDINDMNILYDRVRVTESDIAILKAARKH